MMAIDNDNNIILAGFLDVITFDGDSFSQIDEDKLKQIKSVATDSENRTWFGCLGGVRMYDNGIVSNIPEMTGECDNIAVDSQDRVWVSTLSELYMYDGDVWHTFTQDDGLLDGSILNIVISPDGQPWICHYNGISQYNGISFDQLLPQDIGAHQNKVTDVVWAPDGALWMMNSDFLTRYDGDSTIEYRTIDVLSKWSSFRKVVINEEGVVFILTVDGLAILRDYATGITMENHVTPERLSMSNFPNPFNPSTTISYSLESPADVKLSVYSIAGQKIRNIVDGYQSAGSHSVVWDGRDDSGERVSSGIYISRLISGKRAISHKMLLIK